MSFLPTFLSNGFEKIKSAIQKTNDDHPAFLKVVAAVATAKLLYSAYSKYQYSRMLFPNKESRSNKAVLITGCDTGFGNVLAKQLDGLGYKVIATCLKKESCARLNEGLSKNSLTFVMDVTNVKQVEGLSSL